MDKILSLRAYVATAKHSSFSAAARELNVVPSVVTKRINELEATIGASLFERTTRSVTPTSLGAAHVEQAIQLLRKLDELTGGPSVRPEDIEGRLRVKVPTALATTRLRPAFARFQSVFPKVDLEIALLDRQISPVEDGYDLAIGVIALHPGGVIEEVLCPIRSVVCASPDYIARKGLPAHPRELPEHDCLSFFPTQSEWLFEQNGATVRITLHPRFSANDLLLLLTAALQGNGLALLPDYVIGDALTTGELVHVLPDWIVPPGKIWAVMPEHRASDLALRALLDVLKDELADIGR
jgi:DNA-binding transcriptional LysR family regulator